MQVNKIDNTSFKQTFMPGYNQYTDIQKEIGNDIMAKTENLPTSLNEVPFRPDLFVSRCGKTDSLYVFSCCKTYDYNILSYIYENKLFVGKYDAHHPFQIEDVAKAKSKKIVNSIKATALIILDITKKRLKNFI